MRITNNSNLPAYWLRYAQQNQYDKGPAEVSVTGLLKPPRMSAMETNGSTPPTVDLADLMPSLLGNAWHEAMQNCMGSDAIIEKRFYMSHNKVLISGQVDYMAPDGNGGWELHDHKTTTGWGLVYSDFEPKQEWVEQLNLYVTLLERNGYYPVSKITVGVMIRDWIPSKVGRDKNYPESMGSIMDIPVWDKESRDMFLDRVVGEYLAAKEELPECSPEQRWERGHKWQVKKEGRKSAIRNFDTFEEADEEMATRQERHPDWNLYIEERPGHSVRCERYCPVAHHCSQWTEIQKRNQEIET